MLCGLVVYVALFSINLLQTQDKGISQSRKFKPRKSLIIMFLFEPLRKTFTSWGLR